MQPAIWVILDTEDVFQGELRSFSCGHVSMYTQNAEAWLTIGIAGKHARYEVFSGKSCTEICFGKELKHE